MTKVEHLLVVVLAFTEWQGDVPNFGSCQTFDIEFILHDLLS